jgi:hypothetical protein
MRSVRPSDVLAALPLSPVKAGYCRCGCGEPTRPAGVRDARDGHVPGEPMPYRPWHVKRKPPGIRVCDRGHVTRCWLWTGPGTSRYPLLRLRDGRYVAVLPIVYGRFVKVLRAAEQVRRHCGQEFCVRPDHLYTRSDSLIYVERAASDGSCQCGCGQRTPLARSSDASRSRVAGLPLRFKPGHRPHGQHAHLLIMRTLDTGWLSPCWLPAGEGRIDRYPDSAKGRLHRAAFELALGRIPSGFVAHHQCQTPRCCNPDHLALITAAANSSVGSSEGWAEEAIARIRAAHPRRHRYPAEEPEYAIVRLDYATPCWIWLRGVHRGYGLLPLSRGERRLPRGSRRSQCAHRLAYEALVGSIPDGEELDHRCRHAACINPAHLEPVPRAVHVLRTAERRRGQTLREARNDAAALIRAATEGRI